MLPSNGFFSSYFCPYDKAKLCHRPYCHYKHAGKGEKIGVTEYLSDTNVPPVHPQSHYTPLYTIEDNGSSSGYVPTPVSKCTGILKTSREPTSFTIPIYNPTPISKLKELNHAHFTPKYSRPVKRKKKVEEYDPTEVKCSKTVTFAPPPSDVRTDSLPTFSSSEDEGGEPSVVPTFSDDDLDECPPAPLLPKPTPTPVPVEEEKKEEEDIDESKIDQFSLVDKILVDCKKKEKLLTITSKSSKTSSSQKPKTEKVSKLKKKSPVKNKEEKDGISDIYNCDLATSKKDSKKSKLREESSGSSKGSSKTSETLLSITKSDKSESKIKHKDTKHKEKSSKDEKYKSDSKTKHSNKSDSEKSSKISKSEKSKSSLQSDKSSSSKKSESSNSKSSKSREDKLQDEKVSSSCISKNKDQNSLSHSSETSPKKRNSKDDSEHLPSKLKERSESKRTSKISSKVEKMEVSDDSSVEEILEDAISLSSDSDPDDECKRIFEETFLSSDNHSSVSCNDPPPKKKKAEVRDVTASQKKRLAHAAATSDVKKPMSKARQIAMKQMLNPEQVMINRYAKTRAIHEETQEQLNSMKRLSTSLGRDPNRKRLCLPPNSSLLMAMEKKNLDETSNFSPLPSTVSKSLKVTKRVAHIPEVCKKSRPIIPAAFGSKVPTVVRQKFLNAFIDEYLKFSSTEDEAYNSALEEEKKVYERCSSKNIYMNVASNALNRLRHRPDTSKKSDGVTSTTKTISHEDVLNGPIAQRTSFSIAKKKPAPVIELKGPTLYEHLSEYILTEDQLKENGFPFPHPTELGRAVLQGIYATRTKYCNDPFKRTCCRCQKTYYVNVDGDYVREEECDFHWGRLWKRKIAGAFESRYTCCQGDSESDGCCVNIGHVFEGSEAHAMKGFVSTLSKTPPPDNYHGIYAMDCEMCYTTAGIELTRVSVIGPDLKPVYETFVKPQNKVIDYNTRFSGITEENLLDEKTTIRDVQAVLLCMFNSRTILIGHSLESDLKALKIFHNTVVDTSVVFPHKMGLPYKRALRTLTVEKLNKIIQNDVGGHDSIEDAAACMELMIWKIKEDLKGNR